MTTCLKLTNIPEHLKNEEILHALLKKYGTPRNIYFSFKKPEVTFHGYVTFSNEELKTAKNGLSTLMTVSEVSEEKYKEFSHQGKNPHSGRRNMDQHFKSQSQTFRESAYQAAPKMNSPASSTDKLSSSLSNGSSDDTAYSSHSPEDDSLLHNSPISMPPIAVLGARARLNHSNANPPSDSLEKGPCLSCHNLAPYQCALCLGWYCSYICQEKDWPNHSARCRPHLILPLPLRFEKHMPPPTLNSAVESEPMVTKVKPEPIKHNPEPSPADNKAPLPDPSCRTTPKTRISWNNKKGISTNAQSSNRKVTPKDNYQINEDPPQIKSTIKSNTSESLSPSSSQQHRIPSVSNSIQHFEENFLPTDGKPCEVEVIWFENPSKFWVTKVADNDFREQLSGLLIKLCPSAPEIIPTPGDICASLFMEDQLYYRALILEVMQDKCKVFYVDYGNTEVVKIKHLKMLPSELVKLCPKQAICCKLANIEPPPKGWNITATGSALKNLACDESTILIATDIVKLDDTWEVSLKNKKGENFCHVLLKQNLGIKPNTTTSPQKLSGKSFLKKISTFQKAGDNCPIKDAFNYLRNLPAIPQKINLKILSVESSRTGLWVEIDPDPTSLPQHYEETLKNAQENPSYKAKRGDTVAAFSPKAHRWLRAQVIETHPLSVRYIDVPAKEEVIIVTPLTETSFPSLLMYCLLETPLLKNRYTLSPNDLTASRTCLIQDALSTNLFSQQYGLIGNATCYAWHHGTVEDLSLSLFYTTVLFGDVCTHLASPHEKIKCSAENFNYDKGTFNISLDNYKNEAITISEILAQTYNRCKHCPNYKFVPNELVAFKDKGIWLRGCIIKESDSNSFQIQALDEAKPPCYITSENIRPLFKDLCERPMCAFEVVLDGIPLQSLGTDIAEVLKDCKTLYVEVLDASCLPFKAKLYFRQVDNPDLTCINDELFSSDEPEEEDLPAPAEYPDKVMFENCKREDLSIGESLQFQVLELSSLPFYGVQLKASAAIDQLTSQITEYAKNQPEEKYEPVKGEVCLALYHLDGLWYRAMVVTAGAPVSHVLFLDFGNYESVDNSCLCKIPAHFLALPFQAIQMTLKDAPMSNSPETLEAIQALVPLGEALSGVVKHKEGLLHHVEIAGIGQAQVASINA